MLTREQKKDQSEQLRATLGDAGTLFLLENTGLSVNEINALRSEIRKTEASYRVVKNSIVKHAVEGTDLEGILPHLVGPKSLAFTGGDGIALAKVLKDFIKDHPELSFKLGYLEGEVLEAREAEKLADMPSKEELISRLLYLLQSPIRRLAVALNTPTQNLASVLKQAAEKETEES